jgi:hypothetical protein
MKMIRRITRRQDLRSFGVKQFLWSGHIFCFNSLVGGADLTDLTESLSNGRRRRKSSYNNKCFTLPYGLSDS